LIIHGRSIASRHRAMLLDYGRNRAEYSPVTARLKPNGIGVEIIGDCDSVPFAGSPTCGSYRERPFAQ
jgi:hypothetical protein